jgi:hypothetical protein
MTTWYVLVEEDTREYTDGEDLKLYRWKLAATRGIGPNEEEAAAAAEQLALQYVPAMIAKRAKPGDEPARKAFLTRDGAWVVSVRQRHRECHIRVTTARLVHKQEEKEGPSMSWKDKLREIF